MAADFAKKLEDAWKKGDLKAAEGAAKSLLEKDKSHPVALQFLAKYALSEKRFKEAAKYWKRLAETSPPHWEIFVGWAQAEENSGNLEAAIEACREGLKKLEGDFLILFVLGQLNHKAGYEKQATTAFFHSADILSRLKAGADEALKKQLSLYDAQLEFARGHLEKSLNGAFLKAVKEVGKKTGARLGRVEQAKYVRFSRQPVTGDALHQPQVFYMPSLTSTPWFKGDSFPFTRDLAKEFEGLKKEILKNFRPEVDAKPALVANQNLSPALKPLADSRDWGFYPFFQYFEKNPEAEKRFPLTFEVLDNLPLYKIEGRVSKAGLKVLKPGVEVPPHFGLTNTTVAVDFPIVAGKECAIKAGVEKKVYEPGKLLIFDDTFAHSFWNKSSAPLILLTFEIWHPNIQANEKTALEAGARAENQWYQNRVYKSLFED